MFSLASCGQIDTMNEIIERGYVRVDWLGIDSTYYYTSDVKTLNPDTIADAVFVQGILLNAGTRDHGYMSEDEGIYTEWSAVGSDITFGE